MQVERILCHCCIIHPASEARGWNRGSSEKRGSSLGGRLMSVCPPVCVRLCVNTNITKLTSEMPDPNKDRQREGGREPLQHGMIISAVFLLSSLVCWWTRGWTWQQREGGEGRLVWWCPRHSNKMGLSKSSLTQFICIAVFAVCGETNLSVCPDWLTLTQFIWSRVIQMLKGSWCVAVLALCIVAAGQLDVFPKVPKKN